jgi:ketosteroid isomerase-like protein
MEERTMTDRVSTSSDESAQVVRSALAAFNAGDSEAFLEHFRDDMRFWMNGSHPLSGPVEGKAAFVELVGKVAAGLSEMIKLEVLNLLPAGDWVVAECQGTATTASGTPYENRYCFLWRVENGKLVEFKEYNDSALVIEKFFS